MRDKLSIIILGIAEIILGILLLVNPVGLAKLILTVLGIILSLIGVFNIISYFRTPPVEAAIKKSLTIGILTILLGMWCIFNGEWFIAIFPLLTTLYGVITLVSGIIKVQWTADMLRMKIGYWDWMAASALMTVLFSVIILLQPFSTATALWIFIGITLIVEAVIDIIAAIFKKPNTDQEQD